MTGASEAIRLVSAPGDRVVVNPPVYPPFFGFLEAAGRDVLEVPLVGGRLDLPALEQAFAEQRPAAYFLCSPHNPTGTVHTRDELEAVARIASAHGVRVVVDEIHAPLVLEGASFTPYLSVAGSGSGFAVLSASKAFNLAGAKAALLVAGEDAADDLARLPWVVSHGPTHLGVVAHTAAFEHGGPWLDALLVALAARRSLLGDLLAEHLPEVAWTPPQATYLSWLDCRALELPDEPSGWLLEHARVAVNDGRDFGAVGAGHVRLNYATSREVLTEAISRMSAAARGGRRGASA